MSRGLVRLRIALHIFHVGVRIKSLFHTNWNKYYQLTTLRMVSTSWMKMLLFWSLIHFKSSYSKTVFYKLFVSVMLKLKDIWKGVKHMIQKLECIYSLLHDKLQFLSHTWLLNLFAKWNKKIYIQANSSVGWAPTYGMFCWYLNIFPFLGGGAKYTRDHCLNHTLPYSM